MYYTVTMPRLTLHEFHKTGLGDKVVFSLVYRDLSNFSESFDDVM